MDFEYNVLGRVVTGTGYRPVRSGPVEDSLPAGRNDFFSTGPVGIFFQFLHVFFEKLA